MKREEYYNLPEWSFSQMKVILHCGIDYAVAAKRGMLPAPAGKSLDLGQLAHMFVLGGNAKGFVVSPYETFRTKEAREWRDSVTKEGKAIVDHAQYDAISSIVDNTEAHPMSQRLLKGEKVKHEVELFATASGVNLRGKAVAVLVDKDALVITDIKTTAKFDEWKYWTFRRHYDLQAAVYSLIGSAATKVSPAFCNFYFCVVETVFPYRVQYHHASLEFLENGERKLHRCLEAIKDFGDKEPNFLIEDINELEDFSS